MAGKFGEEKLMEFRLAISFRTSHGGGVMVTLFEAGSVDEAIEKSRPIIRQFSEEDKKKEAPFIEATLRPAKRNLWTAKYYIATETSEERFAEQRLVLR